MDAGDLDRGRLDAALDDWAWYERTEPERIAERAYMADAVQANKCRIDRAIIEFAPNLKLIALAATGTDNVDRGIHIIARREDSGRVAATAGQGGRRKTAGTHDPGSGPRQDWAQRLKRVAPDGDGYGLREALPDHAARGPPGEGVAGSGLV